MIRLAFAVIYLLNVCVGQDFLDPSQSHLAVCYNDTRYTMSRQQLPFSLDNLLAIVERIENHTSFNNAHATYLATYLLKRFRVDGVTSEKIRHGETVPHYELDLYEHKRGNIILKIISQQDFSNPSVDFLTNDEKCALHWMLSHSINKTRMNEEDDFNWRPITPSPRRRRQIYNQQERSEFSRFPRERGVVYTPSGEAVAIGSVLAGIALMRGDSSAIRFSEVDSSIDSSLNNEQMIKLDAATYAINLALDGQRKKFDLGPRGTWNDTICPTEYTLNSQATSMTDALLFGSFDGYFIGKSVWKNYPDQILLSQVLRMYYGDGFKHDRNNRACNRINQLREELKNDGDQYGHITEQLQKAILLLGYSMAGTKSPDKAFDSAKVLISNIRTNYTEANYNFPSQQKCEVLASNTDTKVYPLIDLYVVIDSGYFQSQGRYDEMAAFVTNVASYLDISPHTSHIGLYIENQNLFHHFMPINASSSVAEWKCNVLNFDRTKLRITGYGDPTIETIRALKQMLIDRKKQTRNDINNSEITSRPGVVVLFFRSTGVSHSQEVMWEMEHFRKDHPEVKIIGAGRNRGDVEPFIGKDNSLDFLPILGTVTQMHDRAAKFYTDHLKRVGATIFYPYCERQERTSQHTIMGSLRPFSRQFHMMPSSMFNLSKELKIDVRAQGVMLEACISRDAELFKIPNNRLTDLNCKDILSGGNPNPMFFGDPCSDYAAGYCPAFYIQIKRKDQSESGACQFTGHSQRAGGIVCRTYDDVAYTIKVENGRCSGCIAKITIPLLILCVISSMF